MISPSHPLVRLRIVIYSACVASIHTIYVHSYNKKCYITIHTVCVCISCHNFSFWLFVYLFVCYDDLAKINQAGGPEWFF